MRTFVAALVVVFLAFAAGCGGQSGENNAHFPCTCSDTGGDVRPLYPDAIPPACEPLTAAERACVEEQAPDGRSLPAR